MKPLKITALATAIAVMIPLGMPNVAVATGIGHTLFMRGTIVGMTNGVATICVGRADGATVGQTLNVVRVKTVSGGKGSGSFRREDVAKLRIDAIVDDHFARASVTSGNPAKNDLVELRRDKPA